MTCIGCVSRSDVLRDILNATEPHLQSYSLRSKKVMWEGGREGKKLPNAIVDTAPLCMVD
jgi:hypothetical protein